MTIDEALRRCRSFSWGWADAESFRMVLADYERLRAIVDKLPKTADGVPLVTDDVVWCWRNGYLVSGRYSELGEYTAGKGYDEVPRVLAERDVAYFLIWDQNAKTYDCYSTPEAAEAAKEKP